MKNVTKGEMKQNQLVQLGLMVTYITNSAMDEEPVRSIPINELFENLEQHGFSKEEVRSMMKIASIISDIYYSIYDSQVDYHDFIIRLAYLRVIVERYFGQMSYLTIKDKVTVLRTIAAKVRELDENNGDSDEESDINEI